MSDVRNGSDELRDEIRRFVEEHRAIAPPIGRAHPAHDDDPDERELAWADALRSGRWLCLSWPCELGGRGLTPLECAVVNEEFALAGTTRTVLGVGERLVAPTLLAFGSGDQQRRFLPPILAGAEWWCQGFSEPEAGSDLASVRTRAEQEGDQLRITGQKVWTSEAHRADWILVLCRTDPTVERHCGLSMVAVSTRQPGVLVRPLRQAHGGAGFNEVFLDDAVARLEHVVGGLGRGWDVANSTLATERGGDASVQHVGYAHELDELIGLARGNGRSRDPVVRQRLTRAWTTVQLLRFNGLRQLSAMASGQGIGPTASLHKVLASEHHRDFGELALDVIGPAAMVLPEGPGYQVDEWQRIFFESRSRCISRGTNEIQRNVIAERVLGLPRSPR